jgi:hypothetical protein
MATAVACTAAQRFGLFHQLVSGAVEKRKCRVRSMHENALVGVDQTLL